MKKSGIAAVLLVAGAFAASGLFAQEIKFDGYVNSGLGVVYSSEENAPDPYIAAAGVDSWNNSFRIRLHATYANEAGNAGAFLRLQASGGHNAVSLHSAYGWFSAFDKILTVKGGIVDDGTWNTGGTYLNGDMGEGLGVLARITPISGLDIGLGAYLAETPGEGSNSVFSDNSGVEGISFGSSRYYAQELDQAKYTFSLGYTLPELLKFVAGFRPKSEAGIGAGKTLPSRLRAGASLLAVPNLKAVLELELDNLQDFSSQVGDENAWGAAITDAFSSSGKINIYETFQYNLGSLSAGLWAAQWLSQAEDADLGLYVNPWVSYTLGSIVPRLDLGYGSGARAGFNNNNLNWHRANYNAVYDSDVSVISIRPSVVFNIDSKTFVEIGDLIDIDGNKTTKWGDDDSRISNVFYVDFKWAF
ncbi:MAG: hypothetical protein LBL70_06455 [Treponema sp.]|jgi:hypothetical protein|nr:hypothetical protein [Treponema sp.]